MKRRWLVVAVLCSLLPSVAVAQNTLTEDQVTQLNDLQHEITECGVFFNLSAEGLQRKGTEDALSTAASFGQYRDRLYTDAFQIGKAIGMTREAILARVRLTNTAMLEEMENNFVNFSLLLEKHLKSCVGTYQTYSARLQKIIGQ